MKPPVAMRVRVFEPIDGALMVTSYSAQRAGETGHVGYIPHTPQKDERRPKSPSPLRGRIRAVNDLLGVDSTR